MKILQIAPEYPPHNIGGGGIVVQKISENMKENNDITVIAGYYKTRSFFDNINVENKNGVKIILLPLIPIPKANFQLKTYMPPNIRSIRYLFDQIKNNDFDIVHLHGYGHFLIDYASFLCWIFKKKYILTIHGFPSSPENSGGILRLVYNVYSKILGRFTLTHAAIITAISKSIETDLIRRYRIDKNKIKVIPNGIDLDEYECVEESSKFRIKYNIGDSFLILSIGRLSWMKGFQYLIIAMPDILKQNPATKLVIIGNDEGYESELRNIIKKLDLDDKVILTGFVDGITKKMAIKDADIFVIPSLVEPFGLIALEAMAGKKPIVSTNIGGLKDILRNDIDALLINPKSSYDISGAIKKIIADKTMSSYLASNAMKKVKKYEWKKISKIYIDLFKDITVSIYER